MAPKESILTIVFVVIIGAVFAVGDLKVEQLKSENRQLSNQINELLDAIDRMAEKDY